MQKSRISYKIYAMKTLAEVARFHGHMCPGLALGYRVSKFAIEELGKRAKDEELVAVVENDSCAVDAVQLMTGCTFGKGNLIFKDYGKQVYTFIRRPGIRRPATRRSEGQALRVSIDWSPPEETPEDARMWKKYMKGVRTPDVLNAVHKRKSRKIDSILKAKDTELFKVKKVKVRLPEEAHIYKSVTCSVCKEKVMEPRARIKNGKIVCIPCAEEVR